MERTACTACFRPLATDCEEDRNLKLHGFARIEDIIHYRGSYRGQRDLTERQYALLTHEYIQELVENQIQSHFNEKTGQWELIGKIRHELSEDRMKIRALQVASLLPC